MVWLQVKLGVYSFSRDNYCIDMVQWMQRDYANIDELAIVAGTRFFARYDEIPSTDMPVVLHDGKKRLLSFLKSLYTVVTPEAMDSDLGWQRVFNRSIDRLHLTVLSNRYIENNTVEVETKVLRQFFLRMGILEAVRKYCLPQQSMY